MHLILHAWQTLCERIQATTLYSKIHNPTGHLPSPESIHINNKHFNCSTIEWSPPYSSINNRSDIIRVDPHITQYTVYITDNYTGDAVKVNVTETRFTSTIEVDGLCLTYQVSAWNAGGEGELSDPVRESTPQGKLSDFQGFLLVFKFTVALPPS